MLALLASFWLAFALPLVSPGPNFALLLATAVRRGRAASLRIVLGLVIGEAAWGLAAVFGVAALATAEPRLLTLLRVAGGLYLLWLGYGALRSALRADQPPAEAAPLAAGKGGLHDVARGALLMLLNAKAGFFWLSLTGLILGPKLDAVTGLLAVAGATAMSALWHGFLAVALTAPRVAARYAGMRRWIEAVLGAGLAGFGLKVLGSAR